MDSQVRRNPRRPRRRRQKRNQRKAPKASINMLANMTHVPRSVGMNGPFPQDDIVNIRYFERILVAGAVSFIVVDFRINSSWQPRSGGPTGTSSGYIGSIARYASNRVEAFLLSIRVAANEPSISCSFGVVFNDTQPSTAITTYQQALTAITGTSSYFRGTVGQTTGLSIFRSRGSVRIDPGSIVGNPLMYFSDRDFAAATGANPNQSVWGSFILLSDTPAQNLTNGVFLDWDSELRTRFFSPLPLA